MNDWVWQRLAGYSRNWSRDQATFRYRSIYSSYIHEGLKYPVHRHYFGIAGWSIAALEMNLEGVLNPLSHDQASRWLFLSHWSAEHRASGA